MCCCRTPTINGQPNAYSWDGKTFMTRCVAPPTLAEGDTLLFDGPGRCGRGCDSHCHHFRVAKNGSAYHLLVRHGGGEERISFGHSRQPAVLSLLGLAEEDCYWLLQMIYHSVQGQVREAIAETEDKWRRAAAEKRIKTRKQPGRGAV